MALATYDDDSRPAITVDDRRLPVTAAIYDLALSDTDDASQETQDAAGSGGGNISTTEVRK